MNLDFYLNCKLDRVEGKLLIVVGEIFDGTSFSIPVEKYMFTPIDNSNRGWLKVEYHGEQNGRASVTLPTPDNKYGSRVAVKTSLLESGVHTKFVMPKAPVKKKRVP